MTINQYYTPPDAATPHEGRDSKNRNSILNSLNDYLLTAFTLLLGVATAVLALISHRQSRTMQKHEAALRVMADHFENALLETQKTTTLTRESLILTQRPRIIVRFVSLDNEDAVLRWRFEPGGSEKESPGNSRNASDSQCRR